MREEASHIEKKHNIHKIDKQVLLGFFSVAIFFLASGFISYSNTKILRENTAKVTRTHSIILALDELLSMMKDAETGQRGFIITENEKYLDPYKTALANVTVKLNEIEDLTRYNVNQQKIIPTLKEHIRAKLVELDETLDARKTKGFEVSKKMVESHLGKVIMDEIRSDISSMRQEEQVTRVRAISEMDKSYYIALVSGILSGLSGLVLTAAIATLMHRASVARKKQDWLRVGQVGLGAAMIGEQGTEALGVNILKYLSEYLDAHAGAMFIRSGDDFRRIATYGIAHIHGAPERFHVGDGLLGQAAKDAKTFFIDEVPENYLTVSSALGKSKPKYLVVSAAMTDGNVNSVLELGFMHKMDNIAVELLSKMSDSIAVAIKSANYREHLQNLLEETQRQSEELQSQSEELRVNNEELEEQSTALKESQARLEQQQAELEQTNTQLEEQTQQLESQRDDLERATELAQRRSRELEKASQYKSDFLANMSHELRTPLNSSLILSKLLADNPSGNLTAEQVKYALTIQSSGNDLLALINDILDLSKIEAGHMEIRPEMVQLDRMISELTNKFSPVAQQKGLKLITNVAKNCPKNIETDRQRLEQVMKNLLSNAIKFTEKGQIELEVSKVSERHIAFAVKDSGIGIEKEQQQMIFEAFRQADGTISRKYGGTGLGLSISRQIVRLLGGTIELSSKPGKGSTFTIVIPEVFDSSLIGQAHSEYSYMSELAEEQRVKKEATQSNKPVKSSALMTDDRESLSGDSKTILVVEDDESFAKILNDLAHEMNFKCLIASTAEEALVMAKQYIPNAIILDVGLPDNSGLSVLDRLKNNPRTRHIPVHVVSASDYTQKALSLGAVGYMMKPVKREELVETFNKLEMKLSQRMRKVLIIEDDPVQQDSLRKLLATTGVETVGAGTMKEALKKLKKSTFDCMILDLSLPDASGYTLLETLSQEDAYSFPPVIVYTGRDLSADEEQKLRRYSKSIIIKGAKSPERLLDEVTLFLHQVVSDLPQEQQRMIEKAKNRDSVLEGRRILIVEDDSANIYALTSILEPRGALLNVARNGREAVENLQQAEADKKPVDLVLMDVMMPEVDGLTATRTIRKNPEWKKLPIIMLTAKAMKDDQERCIEAGANDYMAKPLDVDKLLSLIRVWMPR